ncbi:hypothetical protein [Mycolicibacterium sp.]|uniref:hypothetical protein n=1 Tax=Mycolicibacterium sp. TaxID=2320850 RepID=UPI0025E32773|nr:hypothetical protein [Mycolicibacterium sp.]
MPTTDGGAEFTTLVRAVLPDGSDVGFAIDFAPVTFSSNNPKRPAAGSWNSSGPDRSEHGRSWGQRLHASDGRRRRAAAVDGARTQ